MPAVPLSRYEFVQVEQDDEGRTFLQVPDPLPTRSFVDDQIHIVGEGETLFSIAWNAYKELLDEEKDIRPSGFWWVIADINGIVDATEPLQVGSRLRIPSVDTLLGELLVPPQFFTRNRET